MHNPICHECICNK